MHRCYLARRRFGRYSSPDTRIEREAKLMLTLGDPLEGGLTTCDDDQLQKVIIWFNEQTTNGRYGRERRYIAEVHLKGGACFLLTKDEFHPLIRLPIVALALAEQTRYRMMREPPPTQITICDNKSIAWWSESHTFRTIELT